MPAGEREKMHCRESDRVRTCLIFVPTVFDCAGAADLGLASVCHQKHAEKSGLSACPIGTSTARRRGKVCAMMTRGSLPASLVPCCRRACKQHGSARAVRGMCEPLGEPLTPLTPAAAMRLNACRPLAMRAPEGGTDGNCHRISQIHGVQKHHLPGEC